MANNDKNLCPTCHSRTSADPANVREQAKEIPADDENLKTSNSGAIPQWSDDPCLSLRGFNGDIFKGFDKVKFKHIKEIQEARIVEEELVGIPEDNRTEFSDIDEDKHIRKTHLIELRQSTEKILNAGGFTLKEYFTLDPDGEEVPVGPNDIVNKEEWTDVDREALYLDKGGEFVTTFVLPDGKTAKSPTIPKGTHIKVIHIEDLRHPLLVGIPALLTSVPIVEGNRKARILNAKKTGGVSYTDAVECTPPEPEE